jgi:DNA (cytosine-5)-methyltransferase 1
MAGCDVIGANEIDPEMAAIYKINHNPKYLYTEDIRAFNQRKDLPFELYDLDILDGSPPCSSFSMAGNREKDWGKSKKFREGQENQTLDDLFFAFLNTVKKLNPKIVIAENVKGMLAGNAKGYVKLIIEKFKELGYKVQLFLLNGASVGLPQKRERVFFIARKSDLRFSDLIFNFNEKLVVLNNIETDSTGEKKLTGLQKKIFQWCLNNNETCGGKASTALFGKRKQFNFVKSLANDASPTITSSCTIAHWKEERMLSVKEILQISSFPYDYKFKNPKLAKYQMGMSVPPLMMYKIVKEIFKQWPLIDLRKTVPTSETVVV